MGSKLATAQGELQACEAHLASKERELDTMRTVAVRAGLQARCKALVECGWQWGEMGKEGLRALESLEIPEGMNGNAHSPSELPYNKPLPDSGTSDLSSIGPSQSASQNTHLPLDAPYTLSIPPAHSISDHMFPNGTAAPLSQVDERGDSSGSEENEQYEVRENERYAATRSKTQTKGKTVDRSLPSSGSKVSFPTSASAPVVTRSKTSRQRRTSGVFGRIGAFFHGSKASNAGSDDESNSYVPDSYSSKSGRWKTRTDKHLSRSRRNSSDDDLRVTYPRTLPPDPTTPLSGTGASSPRLKKRAAKRNTIQAPPKSPTTSGDKGWASDAGQPPKSNGSAKKKKLEAKHESPKSPPSMPNGPALNGSVVNGSALNGPAPKSKRGREVEILKISDEKNTPPSPVTPTSQSLKGKKPSGTALPARLPTEVALSRNSSLSKQSVTSAASAPANTSGSATTIHPTISSSHRHLATGSHRRTTSLDERSPHSGSEGAPKGNKRAMSATRAGGEGPSLMSIVEGVAKQNREHRDPNSMLFLPKAPPPISQTLDLASTSGPPKPVEKSVPRLERSASERSVPSVPVTPSIPPATAPTVHQPSSPEIKPLRSALRSRSPSPQISMPPPAIPTRSPQRPPPTPLPPTQELKHTKDDDASSISSYETTHELLDNDEFDMDTPVQTFATPMMIPPSSPPGLVSSPELVAPVSPSAPEPTPIYPPVPPKSPEVSASHNPGGSDVSKSTDSSNGTSPRRRKSVRMSLPPTFSTTPPALEDTDDTIVDEHGGHRRHEPWSSTPNGGAHHHQGGWNSRIRERDVWQDSSEDEDEEYRKAKRMLSRLSSPPKKHR
ncbi:uncharacterized protein PHACADRAFT_262999 [Phanerochaete carnosa HHB-10118-sp]|uniref:Uncharacterized protein n=1 Tax=Phanerochaete carnosa (strain HHB-10118-sp) TaxID=650164 RepID=K5WL86_PHACS|nr:uncharacterized protein PHACADRAFT_262999 [Phanerochaete carnosa HHB-10118-sp]EKM51047.1 hypothetical protein PHACADRAFT_262999 [Phanerochaete carnosa HHB-10118-sp]